MGGVWEVAGKPLGLLGRFREVVGRLLGGRLGGHCCWEAVGGPLRGIREVLGQLLAGRLLGGSCWEALGMFLGSSREFPGEAILFVVEGIGGTVGGNLVCAIFVGSMH